MGSVYEEITRLETAKADIETAIEGCGVNVPDTDLISTYALYIRQIPSAVFSELNVDPVGGEDKYIQKIELKDGLINATAGGLVSSTSSGLVPKVINTNTTIGSAYYVLASSNGSNTPSWYKLPANAFKNDNTTYTFVSGNGGFTVTPSGGTAQVVSIGKVDWANITNKPDTFTPPAHTHATDNITKLTSYTKATSASDLATTDTLNTALGKLEYKADYAYDWIISVTASDTDEYINKWSEIVGFLDSVKEGTDILDEFVTRKTTQTITGAKTFSGGITLNCGLNINSTNPITWNDGTYHLRIQTTDDSTTNTTVFTFQQSTDTGSNWTDLFTIKDNGYVIANKFITSGGTSSQFVKGDGSLDSNTYLTSLPSHNHSYLKGWTDTRSVATAPNDYNGIFKVVGIKSAGTTLGLTTTQAGSYATLIGWRGWSDSSGGYSWEIASTDKNRLYVRSGSTTEWNNGWQTLAYISDIPVSLKNPNALTLQAGAFSAKTYDGSAAVTVYIPTKTSHLTNDSGFLTQHLSLANYVTLNTALTITGIKTFSAAPLVPYIKLTALSGYLHNTTSYSWRTVYACNCYTAGDHVMIHLTHSYHYLNTDSVTLLVNVGFRNASIMLINSLGGYKAFNKARVRWVDNGSNSYSVYVDVYTYNRTPSTDAFYVTGSGKGSFYAFTESDGAGSVIAEHDIIYNGLSVPNATIGTLTLSGQLTSTLADGTSPFTVTSTTLVTNLNADLLDGTHKSGLFTALSSSSATNLSITVGGTTKTVADMWATNLANKYSSRPTTIDPGVTGDGGMFQFKCTSSVTDTTTDPGAGHILHFNWDTKGGYDAQLLLPVSSSALKVRGMDTGTWQSWATVLTDLNYTSYLGYIGTTAVQASSAALALTGITNLTMNGTYTNNNKLYINSSGCIYPYSTSTRTAGMYGRYDSTKVGHVWSMGTDYKIADDGSSTNNMYGLVYFHSNWSNDKTRNTATRDGSLITEVSTYAEGHQIAFVVNGKVTASLGHRIWSRAGFLKSGSSDSYILLGGGGHKAISDFLLKTEFASKELSSNLTTITKTLVVSKDWVDTGIVFNAATFPNGTGSYIVQLSRDNLYYWTGCLSIVISNNVTAADSDEILLHGGGFDSGFLYYLRTVHDTTNKVVKLQIARNSTYSTSKTYTFKFKKLI